VDALCDRCCLGDWEVIAVQFAFGRGRVCVYNRNSCMKGRKGINSWWLRLKLGSRRAGGEAGDERRARGVVSTGKDLHVWPLSRPPIMSSNCTPQG
jgi:hypothetical protein